MINRQVEEEADFVESLRLRRRRGTKVGPRDPLEGLASRVASKLEEGNFKGAVRLACADDTLVTIHQQHLKP